MISNGVCKNYLCIIYNNILQIHHHFLKPQFVISINFIGTLINNKQNTLIRKKTKMITK